MAGVTVVVIWMLAGSVLDRSPASGGGRGGETGLVRVEVGLFARHVLGQGEDGHAPGDGRLDHFF